MADSMLGKFIRSIRLKNGISDLKAAYRLDVSVKKYLTMESHPEEVDEELINKLFTALGFSSDEVFEYEKFKNFYFVSRNKKRLSIVSSSK